MNKKYGAKFREIYDFKTKEIRKVFTPFIYDNKSIGGKIFIATSEGALEFNKREEALKEAKETYEKFKGEFWD